MRRLLFSCIFLIYAVSCADKNAALLLDKAENIMETQPENAMAILDSLHSAGIRGRENNARYALLYSIALDKNYIDETDDSLVNIAAHWYKRHGTADEKLKTWYYKGRVHQNAGDNETAMESFVTAEQWADKTDDLVTTGMLYSAKATIYQNLFNFDIALLNRQNAARNYKSAKDTSRYINAVISITLNNIINNKAEDIKKNIDTIKNYWESLNINQKSGYYSILLFKNDIQEQDFDIVIQDYLHDVTDSMQINWLQIGEIYCQYNKNDKALECLETYRKITPRYENNAEYHLINAAIKDSTGRYEEALRAYQKYIEITDKEDIGIFESDTKFVEDRELLEYKVRIQKNKCRTFRKTRNGCV